MIWSRKSASAPIAAPLPPVAIDFPPASQLREAIHLGRRTFRHYPKILFACCGAILLLDFDGVDDLLIDALTVHLQYLEEHFRFRGFPGVGGIRSWREEKNKKRRGHVD